MVCMLWVRRPVWPVPGRVGQRGHVTRGNIVASFCAAIHKASDNRGGGRSRAGSVRLIGWKKLFWQMCCYQLMMAAAPEQEMLQEENFRGFFFLGGRRGLWVEGEERHWETKTQPVAAGASSCDCGRRVLQNAWRAAH